MIYLAQQNLLTLLVALFIGLLVGWLIAARARHRIRLSDDAEDNAPLQRTLARAVPPLDAPVHSPEATAHPSTTAGATLLSEPATLGGLAAAEAINTVSEAAREAAHEGESPFLTTPDGPADDLNRIKGIGPRVAALLGQLGVFHYRQIAGWTPAQIAEVDRHLGAFQGRIERDRWQQQARLLAEGRDEDFEREFGAA